MKTRQFDARVVSITTTILVGVLMISAGFSSVNGQGRGRPGGPNLEPEEQNLFRTFITATDPAAKMKAAADLFKKYPHTVVRPRMATVMSDQIAGVKDPTQKVTLVEEFQKTFTQPSETELIMPVLIDAYVSANQPDEVFAKGSEFLSHNPDSLQVLIDLMLVGTDLAKKQNRKFLAQSLQYGNHAIELMEADKKPADMDDANWKTYKATYLPGVYQSMGLLLLITGDRAEAKTRFEKASELAPADPFNFVMLAGIVNDEYQSEAKKYQGMPDGPGKDDELKKAEQMLDAVIDAYAHSIAVSEGNATLKSVHDQYLQDLEAYYKYRHHNSTAGMQELIDKYKTAKP